MSCEFLVFSVCGNLPSELIFLFTQLYTVFITLFIGSLNVSSFLQVCLISINGYLINNLFFKIHLMFKCLSWFCELSEEKILISAKTAIATHGLLNVYEILMVGKI